MAAGQEYAVVLPRAPGGVGTFLTVLQQQRQQKALAMAAAEKQKIAAAEQQQKEYDANFDFAQKMLNDKANLPDDVRMQQGVNERIYNATVQAAIDLQKRGGVSKAELYSRYFPEVQKIKQYKDKELAFKDIKTKLLDEYKGMPGFNGGAAEPLLNNAFYGNGDLDKMTPDEGLLRQALEQNIDQVITSDDAIAQWTGNQGFTDKSKAVSTRGPGGGKTELYSYKMPSFMEIGEDGMPFLPSEDVPLENLSLKSNTIPMKGYAGYLGQARDVADKQVQINNKAQAYIGSALTDKEGKVKLVTDDTFRNMMEDKPTALRISAMATRFKKEYEAQTGEKFDEGPITEDILMRGLAYRKLDQYKKESFRTNQGTTIINNNNGGSGSGKETAAEKKAREAQGTYNSAVNTVVTQQGLKPTVTSKTEKVRIKKPDGTTATMQLFDATPLFRGGQFRTGKAPGARVYVEPGKPGIVYVKASADDPVITLRGQEAQDYFEMMANANSIDTDSYQGAPDAQDVYDYRTLGAKPPTPPATAETGWKLFSPSTWFK